MYLTEGREIYNFIWLTGFPFVKINIYTRHRGKKNSYECPTKNTISIFLLEEEIVEKNVMFIFIIILNFIEFSNHCIKFSYYFPCLFHLILKIYLYFLHLKLCYFTCFVTFRSFSRLCKNARTKGIQFEM